MESTWIVRFCWEIRAAVGALMALCVLASHANAASILAATPGHNVEIPQGGRMTSPSGNSFLTMQEDGNLVLYKSNCSGENCAIWDSTSYGHNGVSYAAIQED